MPIQRLNHAVLYVRDAEVSAAFYEGMLGFVRLPFTGGLPGAVFLRAAGSANDHDLGLFSIGSAAGRSDAGSSTVGLYHLAWEVDTLAELERLAELLDSRGVLVGASDHGTTKSIYAVDPDGLGFEIAWIVPAELIDETAAAAQGRINRLDLEAEKIRYGAMTRSGGGTSGVG